MPKQIWPVAVITVALIACAPAPAARQPSFDLRHDRKEEVGAALVRSGILSLPDDQNAVDAIAPSIALPLPVVTDAVIENEVGPGMAEPLLVGTVTKP